MRCRFVLAQQTKCVRRAAGEPVVRPGRQQSRQGRLQERGRPSPMLSAVTQAALEGDLAAKVQARLASDPKDGLAAGAGVHGPRLVSFPGVHEMRRNTPQR
jgi:hypothetical protein